MSNIKELEDIQKQFEDLKNEINPQSEMNEIQVEKLNNLIEQFSITLNNLNLEKNGKNIK